MVIKPLFLSQVVSSGQEFSLKTGIGGRFIGRVALTPAKPLLLLIRMRNRSLGVPWKAEKAHIEYKVFRIQYNAVSTGKRHPSVGGWNSPGERKWD